MPEEKKSIPKRLQAILWSVDINHLDIEKDKGYIIPQVLNYGNKQDLKWLFRNYNKNEIRNVVIHPTRGIWFRDRLRRFLAYFNIIIDPLEFEAAIRDLSPRRILIEEVWRRKGILKDDFSPRNTL